MMLRNPVALAGRCRLPGLIAELRLWMLFQSLECGVDLFSGMIA